MARSSVTVSTLQVVYTDDRPLPLLGPDSPDGEETFAPWKWDDRIWTDERYENSELAIPSIGDPEIRGLSSSFFQSGVGGQNDLKVKKATKVFQQGNEKWTVQIRHGDYFKYYRKRFLFPDESIVQNIDDTENEDNRNVLQLSEIPRDGSVIWAAIWKRGDNNEPFIYRFIRQKQIFSGIYSASGEAETVDSNGDVIWGNVDTSKHEFIIVWPSDKTTAPKLYFNKDFVFQVGPDSFSHADDFDYCDYLGTRQGDEQQIFFTAYFPIHDNSFSLYKNEISTPLTEGTDYEIDLDRGEVTFPSGSSITKGDRIYAKYKVTVEVEYEPWFASRFLIPSNININPVASIINSGFVYLTEKDLRVARIELTADAPVISDGVYGPVYLGGDYTYLIATAYSAEGYPVPDTEISFYLDEGASPGSNGRINGAAPTVSNPVKVITDANGQARVIYTTSRSVESAGQHITHPSSETASELTLLYDYGINEDSLDSLFIYQVYADDAFQPWIRTTTGDEPGHGGRKVVLYKWTKTDEVGGGESGTRNWQTSDASFTYQHPRTGEVGTFMPIVATSKSNKVLTFSNNLPYTDDVPDDWQLNVTYANGNKVRNPDDGVWYKYIATASTQATEENKPPNPDYWAIYHGMPAYWVAGGKRVKAYAKAYSPLYGATIYATPIELAVEIPEYMNGVYVSDAVKTPYGFRLYDEHTVASALDGVTFLSINPAVGKWPILWDGTSTGRTEDAEPTNRSNILAHSFNVTIP